MSQPPAISNATRFGLLLFTALPCLPGLIFVLAGLWRDPLLHRGGLLPAGQANATHAREQARGLYLAGGVVLLVGTMCSGFVVWKIAHSSPVPDEDGDKIGVDPSDRST